MKPNAFRGYLEQHPKTKWSLVSILAVFVILVAIAVFFDWNLMRGPVARMITAKTGRSASIDGDLRVHLWSWNPTVQINGLHVGNPEWAKHPLMLGADRISLSISLGRLLRGQVVLPKLEIANPEVNLERDANGRASWDFTNQAATPPADGAKPTRLPTIRLLIIRDGKLLVEDKIKKLTLKGTVFAGQEARQGGTGAFELRLTGSMNGKPLRVDFDGGPLINLNPDTPYDFKVAIVASTIHVQATVSILKPFDLSEFTAKLHLSGQDLADAYYLTELALPNTAKYDLQADVHRNNAQFELEHFRGEIGSSDIEGSLSIDTGKKHPFLRAKLVSKNLDFKDLAPTLGAQPTPAAKEQTPTQQTPSEPSATKAVTAPAKDQKLLPDADLQLNRIRGMDADVTYHAASVTAPKLPMREVNFHLTLKDGDLKLDPLSFVLAQGTLSGAVEIDGRKNDPETSIDMRLERVDLSQFKSAKATSAPLSGLMHGRLRVHGAGSSIHKLASNADGDIAIAIPHGEISDILAELTGVERTQSAGTTFCQRKQEN